MWSTVFNSALLFGVAHAAQTYQIIKNYTAPSFFDHFSFFSDPDPTAGFVKYLDMQAANYTGLAGFASSDQFQNSVFLGVSTSTVSQSGRPSTRIQSNDTFNSSTLWIADIRHHPHGCGIWSAYWLVGPDWPVGGEVDLLENINLATTDKYFLHTSTNLSVAKFSDPSMANSTGMNIRGQFSNLSCTVTVESNTGCVSKA